MSVGENICYLSVVGGGVAWAGGAAGRHGGQLRLLPGVVLGAAVVVVADHHQGGRHDQQQQAGRGQVSYSENNINTVCMSIVYTIHNTARSGQREPPRLVLEVGVWGNSTL